MSLSTEYEIEREGYVADLLGKYNDYAIYSWAYHAFNRGWLQAQHDNQMGHLNAILNIIS
jgi:hypothetical protein